MPASSDAMNVTFAPNVSMVPQLPQQQPKLRSNSWRASSTSSGLAALPSRRGGMQPRSMSVDSLDLSKLKIGMSLQALEVLLCRTIPEATRNFSGLQFAGLAARCSKQDSEILVVANWLQDFLAAPSSRELSPSILSDIHGFIGLIRQWNGEYESSQRAYVSAAWIAQRALPKQLAVSLYRLGTSYGKTGHPKQMRSTLQKALAVYYMPEREEM